MRLLLFITILSGVVFTASGQDCTFTITGKVIDKSNGKPLDFATIKIIEKQRGTIADVNGDFVLTNICTGNIHLEVSYIGYEFVRNFYSIKTDTVIIITLVQHDQLLSEVTVHGDEEESKTQISQVIDKEKITEEGNKTLSDMLEEIAGVSVIRNGSGITKPIIHGLYGNRVSVLNNGVVQAGQQWGNDHAPEIDPFVADHIAVVKGAAALEYNGSTLGGVVLVEPGHIGNDPHIHGDINYIFQSNGIGHTINTKLERADTWASWRLTATAKGMGDTHAPDYYLTNTGRREANAALQIEKNLAPKWFANAYYSFFHSNIGILRGSQIGNVTDLKIAISRDEPFDTKDTFSYSIDPPSQSVNHHLLKIETDYLIEKNKIIMLRYGGQLNHREEFDVRRNNLSDIPALRMFLQSHLLESSYLSTSANGLEFKSGVQLNYKYNFNDNATTDVLPLIPQYAQAQTGVYVIVQQTKGIYSFEAGGRYDYIQLDVVPITVSSDGEKIIERFTHPFHNYATNLGLKIKTNNAFRASINAGYAQRAPEVNELYSYGLHQGVSGIENGNRSLTKERSLKTIASIEWNPNEKLMVYGTGYYQRINDYIYLQPQNEFEETVRGAFPVYNYEQTDATIYGMDWNFAYKPIPLLKLNLAYAIVRGEDVTQNIPLVYMPADNLTGSFSFLPKDRNKFTHTAIGVSARYVWEQTRLLADQDFLAPPPAYFLLGVNASTTIALNKNKLGVNLRVENILNTSYRDYLNRLRYFADELGVNASIGFNYSF